MIKINFRDDLWKWNEIANVTIDDFEFLYHDTINMRRSVALLAQYRSHFIGIRNVGQIMHFYNTRKI